MATASVHNGPPPRTDYKYHEKTFYGFLHLAKWFLLHMALLLIGLYFGVIQGAVLGAWLLIAIAVAVLVAGVLTTPRAAARQAEDSEHRIERAQPPSEAVMAGDEGQDLEE